MSRAKDVLAALSRDTIKFRAGEISVSDFESSIKSLASKWVGAPLAAGDNGHGGVDRDKKHKWTVRGNKAFASANAELNKAKESAPATPKLDPSRQPKDKLRLGSSPFPVRSPSRASKSAPKPFPGAALAFVVVVLILWLRFRK